MDNKTIFSDFAKAFERKIDKDYYIRLQFNIYDTENGENDIWQVDVKNGNVVLYNEERITPEKTWVLSKNTLIKLYKNEVASPTAFSENPGERKNWDISFNIMDNPMNSLIGLKLSEEEVSIYEKQMNTKEHKDYIKRLHIFNNFFSKEYPTKIIVNEKNGIKIHGNINGICLYNRLDEWKRIFHVYFSIKKGEILEEPAFEFSIYVINGKGVIKAGNEEYEIEAKNYYQIIPKDTIFIENKEDVLLEILVLKL
jgi:hypothetical protein